MRKIALFVLWGLLFSLQVWAQEKTVAGRITDDKGSPLRGVTISSKGNSKLSTTSDENGRFTIKVPASVKSLNFSYVGFQNETVSIGSGADLSVSLRVSTQDLESVVVTGYSREKKPTFTGAAAKVASDKIQQVPMASFDQILQGRAPGLLVTAGSGQPGSSARVQIRGAGSISGGNGPLYILDGIAIEAGVFQGLNPNDFESVDVLKDAASTAQYGARASNGVIVITTKRGKSGKSDINFGVQYGFSDRTNRPFRMMNTAERLQFEEIAGLAGQAANSPVNYAGWYYSQKNPRYNGLTQAQRDLEARAFDSIKGIDVNWQDIFFRDNAPFTQVDLSINGGNEKTRFYLSGNYFQQDGIAIRSDLKRYTVTSNIDHVSADGRLTIGFRNNMGYSIRNFIESENGVALANPFAAAFLSLPYHSLRVPGTQNVAVGNGYTGPNAYDRIFTTTSVTNQIKLVTSLNLNYKIWDGLSARGTIGGDYRQTDGSRFIKPDSWAGRLVNPGLAGLFSENYSKQYQFTVNGGLGYNKTFADKHEVDATALYELVRFWTNNFAYTGFGINPKLPNTPAGITPGSTANNLIPTVGGGNLQNGLESYVGLLRYTYDRRFTVTGSLRRDGSSKAPVKNRYINLWSVGANWMVSNEAFMANVGWLSSLKLRASYGKTANNDGFPGSFSYLATYGNTQYGGVGGIVPTTPGNADLDWEFQKQANIGLDFSLFKDRLRGAIDVYERKTNNLFISQSLSATAGFGTGFNLPVNAGEVRNRGIEYIFDYDVIRSKNFLWTVSVNGSYNDNEITSLGQVSEFEQGTSILRKGLPIGSHYTVKWAGVDAATGRGMYYNRDGKITDVYSASQSVAEFGTFNAPWLGGFSTTVRYVGFELSAFFNYQEGFSRFNNETFFYTYGNSPNNQFNLRSDMLSIWQKPGDVSQYQSAASVRQFSSRDIQDASYLRFRNLTIAYNFPVESFQKKKVLKALRVYANAQNLFTWTNWEGFDPEDNNNIAQYEYPALRTVTFGLNVTF